MVDDDQDLSLRTQADGAQAPGTTEADLAKVTVGPVKRLDGPIILSHPDPLWPVQFDREATRIRSILGPRVRLLEHVGSTSVPGLPAKPVIDILLVIDDTTDEDAYVPRLVAAGYVLRLREPDWHEHRLFKGPDTNINLHVFSVGSQEIERMLVFRDHLRTHPVAVDRYLAAKRRLAKRDWAFAQQYADAKSVVVEAILAEAFAERGADRRPR